MNNLIIQQDQTLTMSSYDVWVKLNQIRANDKCVQVRHDQFLSRLEDECDDLGVCKTFAHPQNKQEVKYYDLNHDQILLIGMREMRQVRKKVLEWIKTLSSNEPRIPTNFAEALQLAADQAKQLELAAPKVAFVDNLVNRDNLMNATQVGQKHKLSAVILNRHLSELNVYNKAVKRGKAFQQWFIDKGLGEMKQTEMGYPQCLFTTLGEQWINEKLITEGVV